MLAQSTKLRTNLAGAQLTVAPSHLCTKVYSHFTSCYVESVAVSIESFCSLLPCTCVTTSGHAVRNTDSRLSCRCRRHVLDRLRLEERAIDVGV